MSLVMKMNPTLTKLFIKKSRFWRRIENKKKITVLSITLLEIHTSSKVTSIEPQAQDS